MTDLQFFGSESSPPMLLLNTVLKAVNNIRDKLSVVDAKELSQLGGTTAASLEIWVGGDGTTCL